MYRLTLFDRLLVIGLVSAMAMAGLLPFLRPVFREWRRTICSSRLRAICSATFLLTLVYMGGSLNKQPIGDPLIQKILLGPNVVELLRDASPSMPPWYQNLGYPTTDTDGDGIPDYWERRTHTNRQVPDADADYDHDGVDNAEEFRHQCDPLTKDTDGDGLTDREEINGAALELVGFDPLTPCEYPVDTSDAEAWGTGWNPVRFVGVNVGGFPLNVGYPDEDDDNVDVLVTVDSSRYAELVWEDGTDTKRLLMPPCTNLVLRLRVPASESSSVSLSAATGATGLWKAALRAEWDTRRGLPMERNRVQISEGIFVDMEDFPDIFTGVLPGTFDAANEPMHGTEPTRDAAGTNPASIRGLFSRKSIELKSGDGFCLIHGPNLIVTAACENVSMPLEWGVEGRGSVSLDSYVFIPEDYGWQSDEMRISCAKRSDKKNLVLQAEETYRAVPCGQPQTNFVGACWLSSHNPTNATDHLPHVYEEVVRYFPNCSPTTNTVVVLGWTHNTLILWLRNLVRKITGQPEDDETDHCISILWTAGGATNLWSFLDSSCLPYTNALSIRILENGAITQLPDGILAFGPEPDSRRPRVCNVVLSSADGVSDYDRFWLIINSPTDRRSFEDWYDMFYTNLLWTTTIPIPPYRLSMTTNANGEVSATTPAPYTSQWSSPRELSNGAFMHHDAKYELRTEISGQHGNQATYDVSGRIITTTIAAGTADWFGPYGPLGTPDDASSHRNWDVYPFLKALQLDGNPGVGIPWHWKPSNLSHPCIRQGENLDKYIQCRPCIH